MSPDDDVDDDDDGGGGADSEHGDEDDTMHGLGISEDPDAPWGKEHPDRDSGVEFPPEAG